MFSIRRFLVKVSLVIVLVCLVFCTRSHFTSTANAEQVNFKNYSDDELVDKGHGRVNPIFS
jgi:hypothetical protein